MTKDRFSYAEYLRQRGDKPGMILPDHFGRAEGYGTIDKCPWCDRTNIKKVVPRQITCGNESCKRKQNSLRFSEANKKKAKRA